MIIGIFPLIWVCLENLYYKDYRIAGKNVNMANIQLYYFTFKKILSSFYTLICYFVRYVVSKIKNSINLWYIFFTMVSTEIIIGLHPWLKISFTKAGYYRAEYALMVKSICRQWQGSNELFSKRKNAVGGWICRTIHQFRDRYS